jgi:hypothetical protein
VEVNQRSGDRFVGVGPDAPKVTNANGGVQSGSRYRFDLLDVPSMFALAGVLHYGVDVRDYPVDNWRYIDTHEHINHALTHIMADLGGDTQDDHLVHAFCRMMFALGVRLQGGVWRKDIHDNGEATTAH